MLCDSNPIAFLNLFLYEEFRFKFPILIYYKHKIKNK